MTRSRSQDGGSGARGRGPASALALSGLLTGCGSDAWLVDPAGPLAGGTARLAWLFGGVAALVWIVTLSTLTWAVLRGRRRAAPATDPATTRTQTRAVLAAAVVTVLILFGLALADFLATRGLLAIGRHAEPLVVQVTGHQWWWELTYHPDDPQRRFSTANELRIPVGQPVRLELTSRDVIHSFWVPRLQGKRDLIPGYRNTLWIQADEPGIYRGGCAEFCGLQHANMRLEVIAEAPERFAAWYAAQHAPAQAPSSRVAMEGHDIFVSRRCALCHSVRGTAARGQVGPDLTHLASRRTIAAGVLPNTRAYLGGWIVDPQHLKPGVHMPPNPLPGPELHALLHYLEGLR